MSINTSSFVGQCATVFRILSLLAYPLNQAACPPVNTVYFPILPSEGHATHNAAVLNENKINTIRGIDTAIALKNYQLNTGCRAEKLPNDYSSFSQGRLVCHPERVNLT